MLYSKCLTNPIEKEKRCCRMKLKNKKLKKGEKKKQAHMGESRKPRLISQACSLLNFKP